MDLTRDVIEKIEELTKPTTKEINGFTYCDKEMSPCPEPHRSKIEFISLTGMRDYILEDPDFIGQDMAQLHVAGPDLVYLYEAAAEKYFFDRPVLAAARPMAERFAFGHWFDQETFIIRLQSQFVPTSERTQLLQIIGTMSTEEARTSQDNGVTQQVSARRGVVLAERVDLPNPVNLRPFRTFPEVEQPASAFVLRVRSGREGHDLALFEADGGAWKLEAMRNVADWLRNELKGKEHNIPVLA